MIESLKWDSEFFGCRVGRAVISGGNTPSIESRLGYDLIYLLISPADKEANTWAVASGALLVDEKRTYSMALPLTVSPSSQQMRMQIWSFTDLPDSAAYREDVIRIGLQSAIHSRFRVDPRTRNSADTLYRLWMEGSLTGRIAYDVLIAAGDDNGIPIGVLTLGEKGDRADIGILAVDEGARGLGAGMSLVNAAARQAFDRGHATLQVVTQGANKEACAFYNAANFTLEHTIHVYHLWQK